MEGSQGRRLASVCTQLEEDAGRNGRERRVENATHLLEAWDCIWSHGALAQARAIQVAASSLWAARERRLLPGGGHGTMLRHDGAAQREEGPTVERQLARPTAIAVRRAMLYKIVEGYTADYTAKSRCIALYIGHALRHGPP